MKKRILFLMMCSMTLISSLTVVAATNEQGGISNRRDTNYYYVDGRFFWLETVNRGGYYDDDGKLQPWNVASPTTDMFDNNITALGKTYDNGYSVYTYNLKNPSNTYDSYGWWYDNYYYQKEQYNVWRRTKSTPSVSSVTISGGVQVGNIHYVKPGQVATVKIVGYQDFAGNKYGEWDYIRDTYFYLEGNTVAGAYVRRSSGAVTVYNPNSKVNIGYNSSSLGDVKGDTNRQVTTTINVSYPNTGSWSKIKAKVDSYNEKASAVYDSGKYIECDGVAPSISYNGVNQNWQKANSIYVTLTATDSQVGLSTLQYSLSGATNLGATNISSGSSATITNEGVTTIRTTATDKLGNTSNDVAYVKIDRSAPTSSYSNAGNNNGVVTINISASDAYSGVNRIVLPSNSREGSREVYSTSASFTVSQNGSYTYYVHDNVGNTQTVTVTVTNADNIPPTGLYNPNSKDWTNGTITTTLYPSDNVAVKNYNYTVYKDGNTWATKSVNGGDGTSITMNGGTGKYHIVANIYDTSNNHGTATSGYYYIDSTPPSGSYSVNSSPWTSNNVTTTFTPTDAHSGVNRHSYNIEKYENGRWVYYSSDSIYGAGSKTHTFSSTGIWRIVSTVIDNVGLSTTVTSGSFYVDKTQPNLTISPTSKDWTNQNITINWSGSDSDSGFLKYRYRTKIGSGSYGAWSNYTSGTTTGTYTFSSEGENYIEIEAVDAVGNTRVVTGGPYRIDKTAPTSNITVPSFIPNTETVATITFSNLTDNLSGVTKIEASFDPQFKTEVVSKTNPGSSNTLSLNTGVKYGIHNIYVRIYDKAGNVLNKTLTTEIEARKPNVPTIITPKEDELFMSGEAIDFNWTYSDPANLEQVRATIIITSLDRGTVITYPIDGSVTDYSTILSVIPGHYNVQVEVENSQGKTNISVPTKIRVERYKTDGKLATINIDTKSMMIRQIDIVVDRDTPSIYSNGATIGKTTIKGYILLPEGANNGANSVFNTNLSTNTTNKIPFEIKNERSTTPILLPRRVNAVKIVFELNTTHEDISPILDHITVYAR